MSRYIYIRAWCRLLGSFPAFTECEIARAEENHAPPTAIYRRDNGAWATFEEIRREDTRQAIQTIVDEMERGKRPKRHSVGREADT